MDKLDTLEHLQRNLVNREKTLEALSIVRNSLICGLTTEKILREHKGFLSRRNELLANIEINLVTLQTLDLQNQANDYAKLLNQALEIGVSVHREVQQF